MIEERSQVRDAAAKGPIFLTSIMGLLFLAGCFAKQPKSMSEAVTLMTNYGQQGKDDKAIKVGLDWVQAHPEDPSGNGFVYMQIAIVYLGKASKDPTHEEEWIQQAVKYFDKDLSAHQPEHVDIEFYSVGRGFEAAGDMSSMNGCLYYGRALKEFEEERPHIQGDSYTSAGTTVPLAPMRQENEKAFERVKGKFAKAGCK